MYNGHLENGVVVLGEAPGLPDGTEVVVHVVNSSCHDEEEGPILGEHGQTLGQKLMKHAGTVVGLPPDASTNLDHYLYGAPKREL